MTPTASWILLAATVLVAVCHGQQNPSILEDARVHPTSDGSFGFLYRTQDGIAHAAKGDPGGAVHGRFTYTDPTGLKVNFNYNAGAQAVSQKKSQTEPVAQSRAQPQYQPPPPPPAQYQPADQSQYRAPPRYTQAQYRDEYQQPAYEQQPQYREPEPRYNPRPQYRQPVRNDLYEDDYYNQQRYNRP